MEQSPEHAYINYTRAQQSQLDLESVSRMAISDEESYTSLSTGSEDVHPYDEIRLEMRNETVFDVEICDTDASLRCNLHGHYKIVLTDTSLVLMDNNLDYAAYSWPLYTIRRFGVQNETLSLDVGRRAPCGEGLFNFKAQHPRSIYDRLNERCNPK
ncbi:hypothetical protein CHS0354_003869 [Potamilus streckersoni]|uniref:IRS-type PTB domain-containing protein n=1 Tax=Potamilus streckersoni TaxID=2493646 RepID=A0AAE0TIW9_9BIVA|nr:hypothetical protein CHS0354_003869 [Potamilus streckersoni]